MHDHDLVDAPPPPSAHAPRRKQGNETVVVRGAPYPAHESDSPDYSHGTRLVWKDVHVDGKARPLIDVLRDADLCSMLSLFRFPTPSPSPDGEGPRGSQRAPARYRSTQVPPSEGAGSSS